MRHDTPDVALLLENIDLGKHKHVYTQDGLHWYKHDKIWCTFQNLSRLI